MGVPVCECTPEWERNEHHNRREQKRCGQGFIWLIMQMIGLKDRTIQYNTFIVILSNCPWMKSISLVSLTDLVEESVYRDDGTGIHSHEHQVRTALLKEEGLCN